MAEAEEVATTGKRSNGGLLFLDGCRMMYSSSQNNQQTPTGEAKMTTMTPFSPVPMSGMWKMTVHRGGKRVNRWGPEEAVAEAVDSYRDRGFSVVATPPSVEVGVVTNVVSRFRPRPVSPPAACVATQEEEERCIDCECVLEDGNRIHDQCRDCHAASVALG